MKYVLEIVHIGPVSIYEVSDSYNDVEVSGDDNLIEVTMHDTFDAAKTYGLEYLEKVIQHTGHQTMWLEKMKEDDVQILEW